MSSQYLQVFCDQFTLLVNTDYIEEVTGGLSCNENHQVDWRDKELPYVDLSEILTGKNIENRDCLVLAQSDSKDSFMAVGVGQVANIEAIDDEEFEAMPNLDFPYNEYFDRAYIVPGQQQCVYRLIDFSLTKHIHHDD